MKFTDPVCCVRTQTCCAFPGSVGSRFDLRARGIRTERARGLVGSSLRLSAFARNLPNLSHAKTQSRQAISLEPSAKRLSTRLQRTKSRFQIFFSGSKLANPAAKPMRPTHEDLIPADEDLKPSDEDRIPTCEDLQPRNEEVVHASEE